MRILHISQRYAPARGGAEHHLQTIATYLAQQGHEITVVTTDALHFELFWQPNLPRLTPLKEVIDGVRVFRFPVQHLPAMPLTYHAIRRGLWLLSRLPLAPTNWAYALARYTPYVPALHQWLAQHNEPYDLVVGFNIGYETLLHAGKQFAQRHHLPFVVHPFTHLGTGDQPATDAMSQFYTMRHQVELVTNSDHLIAMSPAEKNYYITQGMPAHRITPLGTGIHLEDVQGGQGERFRQARGIDQPMVLVLSTLSYDKGVTHVVEAVRTLWQQGREVALVLAGQATAEFDAYLAQLPAIDRQRLHILGAISEETKRDVLAACNMLVMPSRVESFGIVYLEAWVYGKPVIGAETWGVKEGVIIPQVNGLLVPFADVPALTRAITTLLDHPDQAQALGQQGQQTVMTTHTWAQKLPKLEALYQHLIR